MKNLLLKKPLLLLLSFSFYTVCFGQVQEEWVARYNGPGNSSDQVRSLAVDNAGNVYVTGESGDARLDFATIKYNTAGVQQWVARYNGPADNDDISRSIAVDQAGNVYVTGSSFGNGTFIDFATVKYNPAGVQQWVARYNSPINGWDEGHEIAVDAEGNVYVTGISGIGVQSTEFDYLTIKYNRDGVEQWVARYDGPGREDWANALALDAAGNVYVTGRSASGEDTAFDHEDDFDYATIKYDNNGNQIWLVRYDGPIEGNLWDEAHDIAVDESGSVYVTGRSIGGFDEDLFDYATVKYDANGNELWSARYAGPDGGADIAFSLVIDAQHNVFVTGQSGGSTFIDADSDFATIRYDANGNQVWVNRYDGPVGGGDLGRALALDSESNVYVTGFSEGTLVGNERGDFATVKYNLAGVRQWVARYDGPGHSLDSPSDIAVDGSGNVYVGGLSTDVGMLTFDFTTIKYSQAETTCGKHDNKILICHKGKKTLCLSPADVADHLAHGDQPGKCDEEADLSLLKKLSGRFHSFCAPNPVSNISKIYFDLPADGKVTLKVYDMTGREIKTLVSGDRKAGFYSINFDASALHKGVYIYRITLKSNSKIRTQTNKIIVH